MTMPALVVDDLPSRLTRERLLSAVVHLPGLQVLDYIDDWWDGQAHVACLVIRGGRRCRRLRVVETGGECVVVPFSRRVAERWLARRRQPPRPELGIPGQRSTSDERSAAGPPRQWDATSDVVRCTTRQCGVLLPIGYDGDCPVCGDAGG
jgi:hypothetical protein